MKVFSHVPFIFRNVELGKGESDFDVSKLNTSERAHFDDLVKADVIRVYDAATLPPATPTGTDGFTGSPEPNSLPALDATASPYNQTPPAAADAIAKAGVEKAKATQPDAPAKAQSDATTKSTAPAAPTDPFLPTPPVATTTTTLDAPAPTLADDAKTKTTKKG